VNARTIALEVKLLVDDTNVEAAGLSELYGDCTGPSFVQSRWSRVQYHNQRPHFLDVRSSTALLCSVLIRHSPQEIKIRLPADASPKYHLVVSFYHVKCDLSKTKSTPETLLARSYIPLFPNGRYFSNLPLLSPSTS